MNTSDSAEITRGRIGLIDLPALAETLTQCGMQVVTGPDFRAAATAIIAESKTAGAFPIIVNDIPAPGLRAWVGNLQQKTPVRVAVVRNDDNPVVTAETVAEIRYPATIDTILAAVGLQPLGGPAGSQVFPPAAQTPEPVGIELPELDFFDDEPVPAVAPVPAAEEEDPFASSPIQAAAPVAVTAPLDDWDSAPAATVLHAPAPAPMEAPFIAETPPAAVQVQPVDEWDTAHAAPVFNTPVPSVAPVMPAHPVDEWDTAPAAPAPASRRAARAAAQLAEGVQQSAPAPMQAPAPVAEPIIQEQQYLAPVMAPAPVQYQAPVMAPPAEDFGDWDTPELPVAPIHLQAPVPAETYFAPGAPVQQDFVEAPSGSPVWPGHQTQAVRAPEPDSTGIFDDFEASKLIGTGRSAAGLGAFVINYSGKGGVGKSTTSLQLASVAAEAGLRVVLIDGNSGQGDLRTYLRLNRTNLPTMYDAAIGSIKDAILTPATINANREQNLGEINFAFIGAPPDDINDPSVVTDALYRDVIHFARRNADLVIMDTQIIESTDRTGVVNTLLLPALVHDAWGIGVADMSTVGVNNLNNRLRKFINEGVPTSRLMVLINQVHPEQMEMASKAVNYFRNLGTFLGAVEADISIKHDMNAGRINSDNAQLRAVMAKALLRITGNEAFRAVADYTPEVEKKQGLIGRLLGRKAA